MTTSVQTKCFCCLTLFLLFVCILTSLLLFLVLPNYLTGYGYELDRMEECKCSENKNKGLPDLSSGSKYKKPKNMTKLSSKLPLMRRPKINCIPLPVIGTFSDEENFNKVEDYPFLVSISRVFFLDDRKDKRFLCSGAVVSNIWVLTASSCISDVEKIDFLEVRSSSPYWSEGGVTYKVIGINKPLKNLVLLIVYPYFTFTRVLRKIDVLIDRKLIIYQSALSIGWDNVPSKQSHQVTFKKFNTMKWSNRTCNNKETCKIAEVNSYNSCDGIPSGRLLVPSCYNLVGLQEGSDCGKNKKSKFINLQDSRIQIWLGSILVDENQKTYKIPDLHPFLIYNHFSDNISLDKCTYNSLEEETDVHTSFSSTI